RPRLMWLFLIGALAGGNAGHAQSQATVQERADQFLALVNAGYQSLYRVESEAQWLAATDVSPIHDAASETAGKARAAFVGNPASSNCAAFATASPVNSGTLITSPSRSPAMA